MYCGEISTKFPELDDNWGHAFPLEVFDEVFIMVEGFLPDIFVWEEVGMS